MTQRGYLDVLTNRWYFRFFLNCVKASSSADINPPSYEEFRQSIFEKKFGVTRENEDIFRTRLKREKIPSSPEGREFFFSVPRGYSKETTSVLLDFLNITMQTPQRVVDPRGHSILSLSDSRNESLLRNDPHEVSQ
ncbi:hypothetical protein G5I_03931 [Acromyrmex echinatior]|uniref:Uncharacterized protein n=1 Tax=Acromyrmex echinatior TaxID=103372 RepID=F4WE99_ACREC|nr:hypothetical protein G5I_03931 [Acromyrmex echinatior]